MSRERTQRISPSPAQADDRLTEFGWLRSPGSSRRAEWLEGCERELQRCRTEANFSAHRARAEEALGEATGCPEAGAPALVGNGILSLDRRAGYGTRVLVHRADTDDPGEVVFVPGVGQAIDWFFPDRSGEAVAVGLSVGGSERSIGRIISLQGGCARILDDELRGVRHACVSWMPDSASFIYSRFPEDRPYGRELWTHRLGSLQSDDLPVWRNSLDSVEWPDAEVAPDGRRALVHVSIGWTRTDVHLLDLEGGTRAAVSVGALGLNRFHFSPSGRIFGVTGVDAPFGRVVEVDVNRPELENWRTVLAESDTVLDDCSPGEDGIALVGERELGARLGFVPLPDAEALGEPVWAPLPIGQVAIRFPTPSQSLMRSRAVVRDHAGDLIVSWSEPARPSTLLRWRPGASLSELRDDVDPLAGGRLSTRSLSIPADDGVALPLIVLEPFGSAGRALPTLLHGYGGFGLSATAGYHEAAVAWALLGGRAVIAGLRGGRERGWAWHAAGRLEKRQRVFDDLAAVADGLVAADECRRKELAIWGSSNGGLVMAATIVQRPALCAAVHASVPMTDMLGYHQLSIARLWLGDFGDPDEPADRAWLRDLSPMHTLPPRGTRLPDVIVTTGRNDTRVDPFHAYAFVSALQDLRDPQDEARLLLREDLDGGHGIGKPAAAFVDERADVFAMMLDSFDRRTGE